MSDYFCRIRHHNKYPRALDDRETTHSSTLDSSNRHRFWRDDSRINYCFTAVVSLVYEFAWWGRYHPFYVPARSIGVLLEEEGATWVQVYHTILAPEPAIPLVCVPDDSVYVQNPIILYSAKQEIDVGYIIHEMRERRLDLFSLFG
jgi:hypothetical protein